MGSGPVDNIVSVRFTATILTSPSQPGSNKIEKFYFMSRQFEKLSQPYFYNVTIEFLVIHYFMKPDISKLSNSHLIRLDAKKDFYRKPFSLICVFGMQRNNNNNTTIGSPQKTGKI